MFEVDDFNPLHEKPSCDFKKFIDFDKQRHIFYYNVYSDENHYVLKIPMVEEIGDHQSRQKKEFKIEKFDLTKYLFILNCEQKYYFS